jgi:ATP-dependent Lon protease
MRGERLPLFPLRLVLFPRAALPLHIFEERYKILIDECVRGGKEFGINCMRDDQVSSVGCSAVVTDVVHCFEDGSMDIVVEGRRRYKLSSYGFVHYLDPVRERVDETLERDTVRLYNTLIEEVYPTKEHQVPLDLLGEETSFLLVPKAGMDIDQRQRFLELSSENERLAMLHAYFTEVIPKLKQAQEIDRVIWSDGYL